MKKAIILASGGIDSSTCIAIAKNLGFDIYSISFDYGQRHKMELECARKVSKYFEAKKHIEITLNFQQFSGSALTSDLTVPKDRSASEMGNGIPITYVPARNTIFLSYALAWAEVLDVHDIFIGVNALDFSGYPDCRPEYIESFQKMANLATKVGVTSEEKIKIHTPLIQMNKAEIIKRGIELNFDYSLTHSCYDPTSDGLACGHCDACQLRLEGFREAGYSDKIKYKV